MIDEVDRPIQNQILSDVLCFYSVFTLIVDVSDRLVSYVDRAPCSGPKCCQLYQGQCDMEPDDERILNEAKLFEFCKETVDFEQCNSEDD